jgi:hypothetical protein
MYIFSGEFINVVLFAIIGVHSVALPGAPSSTFLQSLEGGGGAAPQVLELALARQRTGAA